LLSGINVNLLEAVRAYVEDHKQRNQSVSLEELFRRYVAQKERSPKFVEGFKQTLRCFPDHSLIVSDLKSQDVEAAFASRPNGSKRQHLVRTGAVLSYGVRKGFCKTDVSKAVDKPTVGAQRSSDLNARDSRSATQRCARE
jgi:hypothetical protein